MKLLEGKVAIITGASRGIGSGIAKVFAQHGANVAFTYSSSAESALVLENELNALGIKAKGYQSNAADFNEAQTFVDAVLADFGTVDVLINNAGRGFGGPIEAFSAAECLAQLDLNIVGNIRMAKAVLPGMRAQKSGLIIQLSSIAGRLAVPGFGIYHASKWGVEGLSEAMRYELAPLGIDVAIVEPGPFATNFFPSLIIAKDEDIAKAYEHVAAFSAEFGSKTQAAFEDENAPTDPMIVVQLFEELINAPAGSRPLRNVAGLDFGARSINDVIEPLRKGVLDAFQLSDWDGVKA